MAAWADCGDGDDSDSARPGGDAGPGEMDGPPQASCPRPMNSVDGGSSNTGGSESGALCGTAHPGGARYRRSTSPAGTRSAWVRPAANRTTTGFFIHPVIAVDVESEAVRWVWSMRRSGRAPRHRRATSSGRPAEAKESARWLAGYRSAAATLAGAAQLTMVAEPGELRPSMRNDLLPAGLRGIDKPDRAGRCRSRSVEAEWHELFDALTNAPCLSTSEVRVRSGPVGQATREPHRNGTSCGPNGSPRLPGP